MKVIRKSLKWKLSLMFISVILLIVSAIGLFSYFETSRAIQLDVERYSSLILKQARLNMNRYYEEYEQGLLQIGTSEEFQRWLRFNPEETYQVFQVIRLIELNYINSFQFRHPEILSVTMWSKKGNEHHRTFAFGLHKDYTLEDDAWIFQLPLYNKVHIRVGTSTHYLDYDGTPTFMPVMTMVKGFGGANEGYVKIDVSLAPAQKILSEMKLGENDIGIISDEEGRIIVHSDTDRITTKLDENIYAGLNSNSGRFFLEETNEMVVFETMPITGWKLMAVTPYREMAESIYKVRDVTIAITVGGIVLVMPAIIGLTSRMTRRITNLRRTMKQTQTGNFDVRVDIKGIDEVDELGMSFNRMVESLDSAVNQLAETKMVHQKAVLSALQSQINSHFLYNALESINSMAHLADHQEIEETTLALSSMLRYTSNYREQMVTILDDVMHLEHYLHICQVRFGDQLTYSIHVDPDCEDAPCLKAIMQPIAENCVKHGLEETGEQLHIDVSVSYEDNGLMCISIEDNGKGFASEVEAEIQQKLAEGGHGSNYEELSKVGLLNVHYRLQVVCGANSGLRISRGKHGGALVQIVYPVKSLLKEASA